MTGLPLQFALLKNLKLLSLQGCAHITVVPIVIGALRHLAQLYMSNSNISELPDWLTTLPLTHVGISGTKVTELSPQFMRRFNSEGFTLYARNIELKVSEQLVRYRLTVNFYS